VAKVHEDDPYKDVAPVPAQAAKIVTAEPKDDEPVALDGFVTGDGTALGGMQSGEGKGDHVTMQRRASLTGVPGGRGTASAAPPPPPAEDRSRGVGLIGGSANCPFPPEADTDQIDQATATVQVTVRPDGSVLSATVTSDPGHGFGRAARLCLMGKRFQPQLDRSGTPMLGSAPVNVRFNR
jgi:protein TonB